MQAEAADADELARQIHADAVELLRAAGAAGIPLRLIGSLAVRERCPDRIELLELLGRRPVRDLDLVAPAEHEPALEELFERRGYTLDPVVRQSREFGVKRLILYHPEGRYKVDVFLDELVMAHTVDFRGRLELEPVTVPLADLLLSKLQIHETTEHDLIDLAVLLAGDEPIDLDRLAAVLNDDWGFWRSASDNLSALLGALDRFPALPAPAAATVRRRVTEITSHLAAAPRSLRWRLRARVGTRARWYEEVEEVER